MQRATRILGFTQPRQCRLVEGKHGWFEAREEDFIDADVVRASPAFAHRNRNRVLQRITVNPATDSRESNGLNRVLRRQRQAGSIAGRKQLRLAGVAALPYRAHGVYHMLRGQPVAARDFRLTRVAAVKRAALGEQLRSRRAVYRAIDTAAAQQ